MQVIIIESVEALAIQIERELIKHSCDAPVVDSILSCLHPIEVPSEAEKLVRMLEEGFYNATNEFSDLPLEKYRTEAAALITAHSRTVPRAMLDEIADESLMFRSKEDQQEKINKIAAKYGYHAE
jgi:hypothetical protein